MINIAVTSVDVPAGGGAPTVFLALSNDLEQGLRDLPAGDIRFVLSQLSPGVNGGSSEWQSYRTSNGIPNAQADAERGSAGTFVDNSDGTYEYTFAEALTDYAGAPVFDEVKTHRLGIEIRGQAPISSNGIHDFVPAGGALLFERKIVDNDTCNACHDRLEFHGGPRTDVDYCVTCHNPSSVDEDTGNTVDMKALIHNIHVGRDGYIIQGYSPDPHDYSDVQWSQDIRNCQTCHEENDANTPQASNWRLMPNRAACGTCHFNDGDGANGEHDYMIQDGEHPFGLPIDDDTQCLLCHGPDSDIAGGSVRVAVAHEIPTQIESQRFQYNIENVFDMEVGLMPTVEFSVTNPLDGSYYDILNAVEFNTCAFGASRLAIDVAWNTADYTNTGSGSAAPAQPMTMNPLTCFGNPGATEVAGNPAGVHIFSVTAGAALPPEAVGTAAVTIDGHPAVDIDGVINRIPVRNVVEYVGIDGEDAVARRGVIDIQKCDDCHKELTLHGNNRTDNPEVCVTCHNPNATDNVQRVAVDPDDLTDPPTDCLNVYGPDDVTIDFKVMIHAIHASGEIKVPYQVCGGTTIDSGADAASVTDDVVVSPNAAVCSTCHVTDLAKQHMMQNGGDFNAMKAADSTLISSGVETCELCHGEGRSADVELMHGVGDFKFN
jgi:OmcA/MtrC family decaheme c-type cytochrome